MSDASATVHHDGDFTEDFAVTRGVRQGCPLAPFLFALSTEPLMRLLQQAAEENRIQGIKINDSHQLLFLLFADDTETIPRWLFETRCKVATEGEIYTYLGTPIGIGVAEDQIEAFLLEKLARRVSHWSNRMLSWEGRSTVLKHALATMPTYYLMTLGLTANGYTKLDRICWRFLWGQNKDGSYKKPLISWSRICQEKEDGGLGIRSFKDQAQVFKMSLTSRLLDGVDCEWAHLARELLKANFEKKRKNRGKSRTAEEMLLLEDAVERY
ncbi:hypothetical protein R1sor_021685 [Riccia sorocarpa]|uniref:Reverse transcriptase domain-containing protein n=1 Tax=Riccia sorocarpa TaxID=122646 RepID=A0ABD3GLZ8_9MARC